ncbi:MAG TPA: BatA and WFA domain-containing protein, partial [Candidatus Acidoferrum sp.]|nr:BatA and WFA domain-containing protein [Candidatus Acidoferrum sp.]
MTFLAPIPLSLVVWAAAALGGLVVLAYVLKMRRRRFEVPFSTLWQRVLREKEATSLWKRLRRILSLLLTLLVLGLLLLAATEPRLGAADREARSVVILLDASASMKARDGGEDRSGGQRTRMQVAVKEVTDILNGMGGGDVAMVMRVDGQTTPLSRFESDMPRLIDLVGHVQASDTPADLRRALGAAADALRGRASPMIILVGDGAYDPATLESVAWKKPGAPGPRAAGSSTSTSTSTAGAGAGASPASDKRLDLIDLEGIDVRYVPVGDTGENVGIISFNARRYATDKTSYEVYIEVQNFGKKPARRRLVLYNGSLATDVRTLELNPEEFDAAASGHSLPEYAAVVLDDHTPAVLPPPPTNLLYFNPEGEHSPFKVEGSLAAPHITEVDENHPVMRWLVLSDVNFDRAARFDLDRAAGEVALALSVRDPLIAAKRTADRKIVGCSFSLNATDLMLRVAFPLFLVNTLDWFAADEADLLTTYATGTRARVPLDGVLGVSEVTVTSPSGRETRAPLVEGQATFYASEVGVHALRARLAPARGEKAGRVLAEV